MHTPERKNHINENENEEEEGGEEESNFRIIFSLVHGPLAFISHMRDTWPAISVARDSL